MPIVASNAIEDICVVAESAGKISTFLRHMEEHVFENREALHLYAVFWGSTIGERHKACVIVLLKEEDVNWGLVVVSEVGHVIGVKRLLLISEVEVFNIAPERLKKLQLACWPLLLHF